VLRGLTIAGVPVLLGEPLSRSSPQPTVLWFHGFRADALAHAAELERLRDAGFLAVGVDAVGHGARRDEQLAERIARNAGGVMEVVREQVTDTIAELPTLIDALVRDYGAERGRVSVVGVSMGAFLVYQLLVGDLPIRAAVALLGAPNGVPFDDLVRAGERVALLSIIAEHDVNVPPDATIALHARLGDSARLHVLRGSGHLTSAEHWREAMERTFEFLDHNAR
jgi:pimeloyl-ACP methyl ester carboxylesterase